VRNYKTDLQEVQDDKKPQRYVVKNLTNIKRRKADPRYQL